MTGSVLGPQFGAVSNPESFIIKASAETGDPDETAQPTDTATTQEVIRTNADGVTHPPEPDQASLAAARAASGATARRAGASDADLNQLSGFFGLLGGDGNADIGTLIQNAQITADARGVEIIQGEVSGFSILLSFLKGDSNGPIKVPAELIEKAADSLAEAFMNNPDMINDLSLPLPEEVQAILPLISEQINMVHADETKTPDQKRAELEEIHTQLVAALMDDQSPLKNIVAGGFAQAADLMDQFGIREMLSNLVNSLPAPVQSMVAGIAPGLANPTA